jgi:GT2 family glycosyltransferase/glycosyltransferase involved in cell wall biosynthesis
VNTHATYDRRVPDLALSVVVPTRGGATRLPVLLDALAAQTVAEPWEVVFVLDGDVDGSREVIEAYADRLPSRILERAGGDGVSAALAEGYDAAQGEIVLRCDDDLTPGPGFLAGHLARHRSRPAGAPALGVISLTRDVFRDTPYATAYGRPANERLIAQAYARPPEERWRHWAACNSVPKAAYEAVGGFDPTMTYREDSELGLRLARHGVEIVIDPELEIEHRGPAADAQSRVARAFTSGASEQTLDHRHPGAADELRAGGRSPWDRLVSLLARNITSHGVARDWGRRLDRLLPGIPSPLRGKAVALAVEAAAAAGRRSGTTAWVRDSADLPITLNVIYDMSLAQHEREYAEGIRPSRFPYGMERLETHKFCLTEAPRYPPTKITTVIEHRTGVRLQPLRAWHAAQRADATLAVWEHWAELPALLHRLPGPYRSKPLFTLVCWAAEDLRSGGARSMARARRVIEASDLILFLSSNQRDIFLANGARPEQLVCLSFGVATDFFSGDVGSHRDVEFLAVGVDRGRDYPTLIRAVEGTDLEVTLLTTPARARSLALPSNIEPGGVLPPDAYRDLLCRTQVVVVPTHDYAYPTGQTVALNAAASGCAVIVSNTAAMSDYFSAETTALMPAVGDAEGLRSAMVRLRDDPRVRLTMASRGQDHVRQHHHSHVMWDQASERFRGVLTSERLPHPKA